MSQLNLSDQRSLPGIIASRPVFVRRLVAATLMVGLFSAGLAFFSLSRSRMNYEGRADITAQNLVLALTSHITDAVDGIDLTVLTVADEVEKQLSAGRIDAPTINAFIARHRARLPVLDGLRVVNAQGENAYGTGINPLERTVVSDRSYFIRLRADPKAGLVISEPVVGRISKKWSIVLARRVNQPDGSFAGLVYGTITLEHFLSTFSALDIGPHGAVTLRDNDLNLIARYPEPEEFDRVVGQKNATPELQHAVEMHQEAGSFHTFRNLDGIPRTVSFRKVPHRPFYIIVGLAHEDYLAAWWSEIIEVLVPLMLFLLGTIVSAVLIYRGWRRKTDAAQDLARQEEALRASEASLRSILESTADGILAVDNRGKILKTNPQFGDLWRVPKPILDGGDDEALLHFVLDQLTHPDEFLREVRRLYTTDEVSCDTISFKDGRVFERRSAPLTIEGAIRGRVWSFSDITDRKRAEEQLRQASKMESVGRLAGGVAHDFNNMLGVILGHTELALDELDPSQPIHTDLVEIRKAAQRSADLTRQLLAFGRKQTISPQVLDLNKTLTGMLAMLKRLIGENVTLVWQPNAGLWAVRMDPSQIDQIMANLCINARDAIGSTGKITVESANLTLDTAFCADHIGSVPGDYVQLAVSDDGCGMSQETLSHLFEPFFTTKEMGKGTGLGLATVYGIVNQNHGFVTVTSKLGTGTTFSIYLPRHSGTAEMAQADSGKSPGTHGKETILLVEDDSALLTMIMATLKRQGYTVLPANTPDDAIRLAGVYTDSIHLLITDMIMPKMNGLALAHSLTSLIPRLKLLFMSGYSANDIVQDDVLDKGLHFIQKPFPVQDFVTEVRKVLDEP